MATIKKSLTSSWSIFWIILGGAYFFIPLLATVDFSLRARKGEISLLAYQQILSDPQFLRTFAFSLIIGLITIVVSIVRSNGRRSDT